jgi:serine/threonine protein phosphatase PrpC
MKLRYHARTDVGQVRDHNEDYYGVGADADIDRLGTLFVLCDGAGGHAGGEIASRMAAQTILVAYYDDVAADRAEVLVDAFERANAQIYAQQCGMFTTAVAALFYQNTLSIVNVGDSRAYLIRDAAIRQLSRDHSYVGEQIAVGLISPDQAHALPFRHLITRAIGHQVDVEMDCFQLPLQTGDLVVLCCDGLYGLVSDAEIGQIVTSEPLEAAADGLIDLANQRGGFDNITVIVVGVDALDTATPLNRCDDG